MTRLESVDAVEVSDSEESTKHVDDTDSEEGTNTDGKTQ